MNSGKTYQGNYGALFTAMSLLTALLFVSDIIFGSVTIPASDIIASFEDKGDATIRYIILESRLPAALTALFAGGSLAVAGLMMQTFFRNPLAGPSVLGVNSGASLGVALVLLGTAGGSQFAADTGMGWTAVMAGALAGAFAVMALLLLLSNILKNPVTLLVAGMMVGFLVSSAITILNFHADKQGIQNYTVWGMSTFNGQSLETSLHMAFICALLLAASVMMVKPLNLIQLGDRYASNLGLNIKTTKNLLLFITGGLSAVVTAFCGPIAFIGLATPHIARLFISTENHRILLPATVLTGCCIALVCLLVCHLPSSGILPLNAITPLFGAPVIIWVILKSK